MGNKKSKSKKCFPKSRFGPQIHPLIASKVGGPILQEINGSCRFKVASQFEGDKWKLNGIDPSEQQ